MTKKTKIALLILILSAGVQNASAMQSSIVDVLIETGISKKLFKTLAASVQFGFSKKSKEQHKMVFCNPTRDAVAKYLLDDEKIRNSFIRALTPFDDVNSSHKLDNALRPLKLDQNLLNILKEDSFIEFLQKRSRNLPQATPDEKLIRRFFSHLEENYNEIKDAILDEKSPTSDVICKLSTGDYVLVEVQVENPGVTTWNKRALAYAAMLFGNQLRKGDEWSGLIDVTAVNILGMGKDENRPFWPKNSYYKRHYLFQDQVQDPSGSDSIKLDHMQLIQYSLGNVDIEKIKNPEEKAWLDFFKNAHHYNDIPKGSPDIMKLAYERIVAEKLPPQIKELYEQEEKQFGNFKERFEEERNLGKIEVAYDLGLSDEQISEKYQIPLDVVRFAVSEIKNKK